MLIIVFAATGVANAATVKTLKPVNMDYFQSVQYAATDDGFAVASVWFIPPAAPEAADKTFRPFMPDSEKTKFINNISILSPVILTENYLGAGSTLSIKADGTVESISIIMNKDMLATIGYYDFNVKSRGPSIDSIASFRATSLSLRKKLSLPFLSMDGEVEYMAINNTLDTIHYGSLTTTRLLRRGLSGTLGASFISSEVGDGDAGIVAGARFNVSPSISLFANFNGADPMKHMYNNHLLSKADQSIGALTCQGCATESFNAGALVKLGSNMALNIYGFDINDLSGTAGSLVYVVKD